MRSSHSLERLDVAFDDDHPVADAGLVLPATLAQHLGLRELVSEHLDLGDRAGQPNRGDKLLTRDRCPARRGTGRVLGFTLKAPSTLGTRCGVTRASRRSPRARSSAMVWPMPERETLSTPKMLQTTMR
jgi:hypothetical protein